MGEKERIATKSLPIILIALLAGCSLPVAKVNLGSGGLPGDKAIPSANGVTGYKCEDLFIDGKEIEFTLNAGSPTEKSFAEKICSCLRASRTQNAAENAFRQIKTHGIDSWGAKGALAMLGAKIKRCERAIK